MKGAVEVQNKKLRFMPRPNSTANPHKSKINPDNPHNSGHRSVYQVKGQPIQFRISQ
jgi:hypothetical protein